MKSYSVTDYLIILLENSRITVCLTISNFVFCWTLCSDLFPSRQISGMVADAVSKGAKAVVGGRRMDGLFHEPTLLTGVTGGMTCADDEIFGPVAAIRK